MTPNDIYAALGKTDLPTPHAVDVTDTDIRIVWTGEHEGRGAIAAQALHQAGLNYLHPTIRNEVGVAIEARKDKTITRFIIARMSKAEYDAAKAGV